jgi:diguanylate cyclase (GGDEF)-like protein
MLHQKFNRSNIFLILLGFIILFQLLNPTYFVYASEDKKRVLFISSYSESFQTVPDQVKGIQSVLEAQNITLDIEYMDSKRLDNDENKLMFYIMLKYKLANLPIYDAIIIGDDNALQFAMDYQEELFPEIPIVFFGINDKKKAALASKNPYMTGIVEETSIEENIAIAHRFDESATKVVALVDSTLTGQGDLQQFNSARASFPELEFYHLNVSDYTYEEFGLIIEGIPNDAIVLFLSMNQDKTGKYMDLKDEFALIKAHAKVPVYRTTVGGVGEGLMGGKMISYEAFGQISAQLVVDILAGTPVETIPLNEDTPYFYVFDYDLIQKYEIDEDLIPEDAVLINKEVNPLEEYWDIIVIVAGTVVFLLLLTIAVIVDNMKRRAMQRELRESNEQLGAIYEELTASEEELRTQNEIIQQSALEVGNLNRKYENAIQTTNSAVWELDLSSMKVKISSNFSEIINNPMPEEEDVQILIERLIDENYKQVLFDEVKRYLHKEIPEINIQVLANAGVEDKKWFLVRGNGLIDEEKNIHLVHGIILDITKMKEQELYIEFYARHDFLTHLPNRMTFMERLDDELKKGYAGAVFLLDIDNFKTINDTLGHLYGDELLKQIANRLLSVVDNDMMVARLGGDEFLVLVSNIPTLEGIEQYAQTLKNVFQEAFVIEGKENHINYSMGITCYPSDSNNMNELIMNADTAMYEIKHREKNNYIYYHHNMKSEINSKRDVEAIIRSALKEDGFYLVYQPQVETTTGDILGFEALLRLKDHAIGPNVFISVAEEAGLIIEIGRWVVKEAVQQIAKWKDKGLTNKVVAINLSSKQLRDTDYIQYIDSLLSQYEVEPGCLEIEITESILLEKSTQTLTFLTNLKELGLKLALDDFGTGYSSINYLTYIPVDKIKLDKSINEKFLALEDNKVINCIISLAHSLNLTITAEGIEDWDKYEKLKQAGCDYIQGYLFSKPIAPFQIEAIYYKNMLSAMD